MCCCMTVSVWMIVQQCVYILLYDYVCVNGRTAIYVCVELRLCIMVERLCLCKWSYDSVFMCCCITVPMWIVVRQRVYALLYDCACVNSRAIVCLGVVVWLCLCEWSYNSVFIYCCMIMSVWMVVRQYVYVLLFDCVCEWSYNSVFMCCCMTVSM